MNEDYSVTDAYHRQATSFDGLWASWQKVRDNDGAGGGDGVTVASFNQQAPREVSRLSHALRNGRYRPRPGRRVYVPKRKGGHRPLDIPAIHDRVAQGAVALAITPLVEAELEDVSFAYRKGRSVAQAVARVALLRRQGWRWVVEADIVRYFENVLHEPLLRQLDGLVRDPALVDLIALWLSDHSREGRGLPQGSPLSPLLANLYLDGLDEAMEGGRLRIVRFADDFVLLAQSEKDAAAALVEAEDWLAAFGLELHGERTRIVPFDDGFRFLGHLFVRSMVLKEVNVDTTPSQAIMDSVQRVTVAEDENDASLPVPRGRWAPRQRTLYLITPGHSLDGDDKHFRVQADGRDLLVLPHSRVDRIECRKGVDLSMQALDLAAASDTPVFRIDKHGETSAVWDTTRPERSALHLKQAAAVLDPARACALAVSLLDARLEGQRKMLRGLRADLRTAETDQAAVSIQRVLRGLRNLYLKGGKVAEADVLMGHEGRAAAKYWPAYLSTFPKGWSAGRRQARERRDPINVLIDCTASLLARDMAVAVRRAGLHEGFSPLHAAQDARNNLALDLMEVLRVPLIERLCHSAVRQGEIRLDHFRRAHDGAQITSEGYKLIVAIYERWLARPVRDPLAGDKVLWRGIIERQATGFARAVETGEPFLPYRTNY